MVLHLIAAGAFAQSMDHDAMGHEELAEPPDLRDLVLHRNPSGTSWQPTSAPMHAFWDADLGAWNAMVHGNVFLGVTSQSSERGATEVDSVNQIMGMASRDVGRTGQVVFRGMLSAEPLTVGDRGYPLLLQTGETADGVPLHDRQHPHDLFMELGAIGRVTPSEAWGLELYVAPAGEPALGPTGFPHRVSAFDDPVAPLGHHWMDSTHISYGVLTAGIFTRTVKLEGSWFNGREPDEMRYDLDLDVPDSVSGRMTFAIGEDLSVQASYGYLPSPELLHPGVAILRITSSATWNVPAGEEANVATTLAWGRNVEEGRVPTDSVLLETDADLGGPPVVFGRLSRDVKSGHDLVLPGVAEEATFETWTASAGFTWLVDVGDHLQTGIGFRGNVSLLPDDLSLAYGTNVPVGAMVFAQLRPPPMRMDEDAPHGEPHGTMHGP